MASSMAASVPGSDITDSKEVDVTNTEARNLPVDPEKLAVPEESEPEQWVTGFKLWSIVAAITLACFLMLLDVAILSTAVPVITSDFKSLDNIGWYGAAYQLSSATLQPLTGKVYSNFNTKWTFFTFLVLFEIGSLICGLATSSNMLIVGRAVAGMGAAGLMNGGMTILTGCAPMPKRPALTGIVFGCAQLGLVAGPLIGGAFTQYVTWRWCFYINLPIGGVAAVLIGFISIPEKVQKLPPRQVLRKLHHHLDLVGFSIFAPAAIMLLLAVQYGGNQYSWNSPTVIGLFCGAGVTFLIWLAWDYRQKDAAMIPLPMLRIRYVWSSCLLMLCVSSGMFMMSYYLPVYFQGVLGKSPATSGVDLLPSILSQLVAAVVSGRLAGKFGYYLPWSVASATLTAVGYGLLGTLGPGSTTGEWAGYQILTGGGRGLGLQMSIVAIQNTVTPAQVPAAMSLAFFAQTMGGALFLSFADTAFTNSLVALLKQDAPTVNPQTVVSAGAYGFRQVVPPAALAGVLDAYAGSVNRVFYMCAGLSCACFALAWATGWVDIRKAPGKSEGAASSKADSLGEV